MESFQTPHSIANEVRMKRTQRSGPFLIVEGPDDSRFYRRFVDPGNCTLIPAFNKDNVIGAVRLLDESHFPGALGLIDCDFDRLDARDLPSENIIRGDDSHDLETMLLRSAALDAVLCEYASPDKLEAFEARSQAPFGTCLVETGRCLGYLRWHSATKGINLRFAGLRFSHFIDSQTLALDHNALFEEIKNRSQNWAIPNAMLAEAGWPHDHEHDPWHVCCGDDLIEILAIALRRAIGSQQGLRADQLRQALRLAYSDGNFAGSELCTSIRNWEKSTGFRVLRR